MKYVLVTGISSGIGYAITQRLTQQGFFVFGSVRRKADGEKLRQHFGPNFRALQFDLRDQEAILRAKKEVEQELGTQALHALINNAGICLNGPLQYLEMEELQKQFDVNLIGTLRVTKAFLALLGARQAPIEEPGRIINMSSISGLVTTPFLTPYCASKYALESLTDGLRLELLPYGIKVVSIIAGPVETAIWEKAMEDEMQWDDTIYEPLFRHRDGLIKRYLSMAVSADKVGRLVHKVIQKKRPRSRYYINSMPWVVKLNQMLPDRLIDKFYQKGYRYLMK
jgi:NAD(P)-dependent dehydrogenase (short-subunit alcohol dehydrogenase family)